MKNINKTLVWLVFVMSTFFIIISCGHNHSAHDHSDHDHDEERAMGVAVHEEGAKTVHLNQAQFKNIEIDTGWFSLKNLSDVIHANGHTKLDPQDQAIISLPLSVVVKSIKVIEGSSVKRGQTLATVSSMEFSDLLLKMTKVTEELNLAENHFEFLKKELDRQKGLANDNINAKRVLEKAQTDLKAEELKIVSLKNQSSILKQTIAMFKSNGSNQVSVIAPISGHITEVDVKIGETIAAGKPMFSIVDNSKMHVDLLIYEKDLAQIKVGQKVRFNLMNQTNKEIQGEIYNIGKSFANDTKSVAVHADIAENDQNLIPGMYINALIDIGENQVKALPETAIVRAEGRAFIFLWENENRVSKEKDEIHFKRIEVKTGSSQLGFIEVSVLEPIASGDRVVLDGAYYLQSHLQKTEGGGGHHH